MRNLGRKPASKLASLLTGRRLEESPSSVSAAFLPRSGLMVQQRHYEISTAGTRIRDDLDPSDAHTIFDRPRCGGGLAVALATYPAGGGAAAEAAARERARESWHRRRARPQAARSPRPGPPGPPSPPATSTVRGGRRRLEGGGRGRAPGQDGQAADLQKTISDPVARKLVEWVILRSDDTESIDVQPLYGVHHRKSELALDRPAAAPRRGDAVGGPPRSRFRARLLRQGTPHHHQGQIRARPRAAAAGRPRRRAKPGAGSAGATTASRATSKTRRSTYSGT